MTLHDEPVWGTPPSGLSLLSKAIHVEIRPILPARAPVVVRLELGNRRSMPGEPSVYVRDRWSAHWHEIAGSSVEAGFVSAVVDEDMMLSGEFTAVCMLKQDWPIESAGSCVRAQGLCTGLGLLLLLLL